MPGEVRWSEFCPFCRLDFNLFEPRLRRKRFVDRPQSHEGADPEPNVQPDPHVSLARVDSYEPATVVVHNLVAEVPRRWDVRSRTQFDHDRPPNS